ncbi:MAG: SDR family NAD(P)-dependent oxidoreductase [Acholeplasmataceae bacterium]
MKYPKQLQFIKNDKLKQHTSNLRIDGKWTVVSGSSSGIGLSTLNKFASMGSNLIMVVRNEEKSKPIQQQIIDTYGVNVDIVIADFADFDSVRHAAEVIIDKYPKIDYLINSVGIHQTKKSISKHGIEMVYTVNHLSVLLFTILLIPKLKESAPSRIIQVNSEGHRFYAPKLNDLNFKKHIYTGLRSYGASKTAQLYSVYELARRLEKDDVTVVAMHPGAVKTHIGQNNGFLYRFFFKHVTSHFLKDVKISSDAIHYLATDPSIVSETGKFFNLTILEEPASHATKKEMQKAVWTSSLEAINLSEDML